MNIRVIKTIKDKKPMTETNDYSISDNINREGSLITIFPEIEYQEIKGFGGAFTEAASTTLDKLSKENRERILKLYFDEENGIGYNYGRVHMNSCDFSLGNYTCVDEGDKTLETFNIKRDEKFFNAIYDCYKNVMIFDDGYVFYYIDNDVLHLIEYSFSYNRAKEILKGILNLKNLKEGILYKKWGQTPFSVCITDIDIESIENKYINLMLN